MLLSAKQLLELSLAQIAAESYLEGAYSGAELVRRLRLGANNYRNATFDPSDPELPSKTRMTDAQIARFDSLFSVEHQRPNDAPELPEFNGSGLSATLLRNKIDGTLTLSIRSTEYADTASGGDWNRDGLPGADGQLISTGFALAQLAALEQYYDWLITEDYLTADTQITVTGYSLGGHLATAFTLMHTEVVSQAVTFNGPGVGELRDGATIAAAVARYRALLANPDLAGIGDDADLRMRADAIALRDAAAPLNQTSIYNDPRHLWAEKAVKAEFGSYFNAFGKSDDAYGEKIVQLIGHAAHGDFQLTANSGRHAPETRVFIEDQPDITGLGAKLAERILGIKSDFGATHSITLIADSLAAMEALRRIDPSLSFNQLFELFASASNQRSFGFIGTQGIAEGNSLESIAQALRKLYTGNDAQLDYSRQGGGFGHLTNRNAYYDALEAASAAIAQGSDRFTSLAPGLSAALDARSLAAAAKADDGMAARYALLNLNPFVIDGGDSARRAALFERHNDEHRLDLANEATPNGLMTTQYIDERAEFLKRVLHYNRADLAYTQTTALPPDAATASDPFFWEDIVWSDNASDITIQRGSSTASTRYVRFGSDDADGGTTALVGGGRRDSLFGMGGSDELHGLAGDDYLEGGLGDDRLQGGAGRDTLRGGPGADTFVFFTGDGSDTIVDADASDALLWDDIRVLEGRRIVEGSFASTSNGDAPFRFSLVPNDANGKDLRITRDGSSDSVTVKNWPDQAAASPALALVTSTNEPGAEPPLGIRLELADPPAPPTPASIIGGTADVDELSDSVLNDLIDAGAGNDGINAMGGGRDLIFAGDGDDFVVSGDFDADWIELGMGQDVALGSLGDDDIFGDAGEDRLDGGIGDDRLYGGDGADLIGGGGGANIIRGGAGGDYVWVGRRTIGAAGTIPLPGHVVLVQGRDWIVQAPVSGGTLGKPVMPIYEEENPHPEVNIAYGDDGDDRIWGDTGADVLDGGADNDVLVGMQGSDLLIGATGDDLLYGDGTRMGTTALDAVPDDSHGDDALYGGDGNDQLYGQGGSDELHGGTGADFLRGDLSHEPELSRSVVQGDDLIEGGAGNDQIIGDGGNDVVSGGDGDDIIYGDALADDLAAEQHGHDRIDGGGGNDQIVGFGGHDTIVAGDGNDLVWADGAANIAVDSAFHGNDIVDGGAGDDYIEGGGGDDSLFGGHGQDRLYGDDGSDDLAGGDQDDQLFGGAGADRLVGGRGVDYLSGGSGADTYVLTQADALIVNGQADTIADSADGNVIAFADGTTAADLVPQLSGGGDLALLFGSSAAYVFGGAAGTIGSLRFADGSTISIERLLGERQTIAVSRTAASNQQALGGAAVDLLAVAEGASNVVVSTGRGDETVVVGANTQAVTFRFNLGDGRDKITFAASTNVATRQPHVVELGAEIHPDEVWLAWRHTGGGRGELALHYSDRDSVALPDVAADAIRQDAKFDLLRFADGTTLDWQALLDRGVRVALAAGADPALGTPLADILVGDATARTFRGGAGDDRITLGRGVESALGEDGSDTVVYGRGDGRDTVDNRGGAAGDVDTLAFESNLALEDVRFLRQGDDLLAQIVDSPDDRATVVGFFANAAAEQLAFGDGTTFDRATVPLSTPASQASAGNDTIYLTDLGETADGLAGDDRVFGGRGADRLRGNSGNDSLLGGAGSDLYDVAAADGHDRIEDRGHGGDVDVLRFAPGVTAAELSFERSGSDGLLIRRGSTQSIEVVGQFSSDTAASHGLERIEFADGAVMTRADIASAASGATNGPDTIVGTAGDDTIDGRGGDDQLYGEAGNDTLLGGDGNDWLYDGTGADVLHGGAGNDNLYSTPGAVDQLFGGPGDDTFFDVKPGDIVVELAGEGTDRIVTASSVDLGGTTVSGMVSGAGLAQVENASLVAGASGSLFGNALDNRLDGNRLGNTLEGRDGDDYLSSGGGTGDAVTGTLDTLRGGNGNDTLDAVASLAGRVVLDGGAGNDRYLLPRDEAFAASLTLIEATGGGVDTVVSGDRVYVLPANFENLVISTAGRIRYSGSTSYVDFNLDGEGNAADNRVEGNGGNNRLYGHAGNDTILGGAGDDTLDGMTGSDVLDGGPGNDTYRLNDDATDTIVEAVGGGFDTVISAFNYTLGANLERLDLATGKKQLSGNGNALDNVINGNSGANTLAGLAGNDTVAGREGADTLFGNDGNDLLFGEDGNDTLVGGTGDDRLDGGGGTDRMEGGTGNDVYVVDSARDMVIELAGEGVDRIESTVTLTLSAQVENLTLLGSAAINGTGNALANVLVGNAGNNILAGAGGADVYVGGSGNDTINTGGSAAERICFVRGHGNDSVSGSGSAGEDRLEVSGGIARSSVVLRRSSNNLVVDLGGGESVTMTNYYAGVRNVGTLRLIADTNWTPGQDGSPVTYEDINVLSFAGSLTNGASVGLSQAMAADASTLTVEQAAPLSSPVSPIAVDDDRRVAAVLEVSIEDWWRAGTDAPAIPMLTAEQFEQAASGFGTAAGFNDAGPRASGFDVPQLAPLLQALDAFGSENALPRAVIRSAWDRVLIHADDSTDLGEMLGGEQSDARELLQTSGAAPMIPEARSQRPTWWRTVHR